MLARLLVVAVLFCGLTGLVVLGNLSFAGLLVCLWKLQQKSETKDSPSSAVASAAG